jgi:hypothetical protein
MSIANQLRRHEALLAGRALPQPLQFAGLTSLARNQAEIRGSSLNDTAVRQLLRHSNMQALLAGNRQRESLLSSNNARLRMLLQDVLDNGSTQG